MKKIRNPWLDKRVERYVWAVMTGRAHLPRYAKLEAEMQSICRIDGQRSFRELWDHAANKHRNTVSNRLSDGYTGVVFAKEKADAA